MVRRLSSHPANTGQQQKSRQYGTDNAQVADMLVPVPEGRDENDS